MRCLPASLFHNSLFVVQVGRRCFSISPSKPSAQSIFTPGNDRIYHPIVVEVILINEFGSMTKTDPYL